MTTLLSDLITDVSRDLRDTGNAVWSTSEITDLINQGIDALGEFYPKEVQDYGTVVIVAGTFTYALPSGFSSIYRIDVWSTSDSYKSVLDHTRPYDGPNSGWDLHNSVLYLPPSLPLLGGDKLRIFGYGPWTQLAATSSTTDLDTSGIWAVRVFCQAEAFQRLVASRADFQQWQVASNNTDVSAAVMMSMAVQARARWTEQKHRIRKYRKTT